MNLYVQYLTLMYDIQFIWNLDDLSLKIERTVL
jgi:hypothetical protein